MVKDRKRGGSRLDISGHPNSQKPNKLLRFLRALLISLGVIAVLMVGAIAYIWFIYAEPPEVPNDSPIIASDGLEIQRNPEGFTVDDRKQDFFTILIIGKDSGHNTDAIMVASYDGNNQEANLISIPRDALVNAERRVRKINSAYAHGFLGGRGHDGGIAQLRQEIRTIIGFVPDFYVLVDFNAFVRLIDAVDGVNINVPFNMRYEEPNGSLSINIPQGERTLNGRDALLFARYRMGSHGGRTITDYQRMENQQQVINALLDELISPASLLRIPEFADIFAENVTTDLSPQNLAWFGRQIATLESGALSTHTIPITGNSGRPMWYELIDPSETLRLVNETINPFTEDIRESDTDIINN